MNDRATIKGMRSKLPGGLLIVALLVLLLLLAYQLWLSYRDQVRSAEISTSNLAAIFKTRLEATLRRTDADLKALTIEIPLVALNPDAVAHYERELNVNLDSRLFDLEEMAAYLVHDANGDTLYASDSAPTQRVNVADQVYFQLLRDDPGAALVFSAVLTDRNSGRQVLVMARALRDQRGNFKGIVRGLLELEYYRKQFLSLDLGSHGVVALRRTDNHAQVLRWPDLPDAMNQPLAPDHPVVKALATGEKVVTLHYVADSENISRIMGIQAMPNYPFYFAVGVGRDEVLAGWRWQVMVVCISTLLLFGLVSALILSLGRLRVREAGILTDLAHSELQFSGLAQLVPVGICHFDDGGKYTYVNDRYAAFAGRSREVLLGSAWSDFVQADDRVRVMAAWKNKSKPENSFVCEFRLVRPDGELMHVIGEVKTETDPGGKVLGYLVAQTDISQRKQAEAELLVAKQQAERANITKTRFLAAASHDLRQPIQAINLFRDALIRTDLSEEQKTITNFLSMSVHSLGELLYSLLDISKLDAGLTRPQMTEVSVEDLFKAVDAEFSTLAREKNLRFKLFYPFKSMVLLTDQGLLLRVLRNLIDNAFKYTELGGVLVGVRKRGSRGIIQVWDTGMGIDPQYGDKIFDECFQVGNPLHDRTKGLGIGLSIARRMARLLEGEVSFRSRPGWGTVFEIALPLAAASVRSGELSPQPGQLASASLEDEYSSRLSGWQVVVIEDDPVVAKSIELSLQILGISVEVFHDPEGALGWPEIMGADFYISDFLLPGMDGLQLLDAIQQRSATPINAVLMTGETSPDRFELLKTSSRWTVLFKPADLSRLLDIMNEVAQIRSAK